MRSLLWLFLFAVPGMLSAQDVGGKSLSLPKGTGFNITPSTPPSTSSGVKAPSIFDKVPKPSGTIETPSKINFGKTNDFINPSTGVTEKLNRDNYKVYERGPTKIHHLGDLRTKSAILRITYRDYSALDGDIVRVYVDGVVMIRAVVLDGASSGFDIPIEKGLHRIDIEALSQGDSGPNTAEFEIFDDQGESIMNNQWSLLLNEKATIGVYRE